MKQTSKQGHKGRKTLKHMAFAILKSEQGTTWSYLRSRFKTGERYDQTPRRTLPQPALGLYSSVYVAADRPQCHTWGYL